MHIPLMTALAGAGIGAGIVKATESDNDSDLVMPFGITSGAMLGYKLGAWSQFLTSWIRRKLFERRLKNYPNATRKTLAKLLADKRFRHVPVFQQTAGKPVDNAFYSPDTPPGSLVENRGWKNIRTGQQVWDYSEFPEKSVYIGSDFNKLPVVAHELGHAHDLRDAGFMSKIAPAALLGISFGGSILSGFALQDALENNTSPLPALAGLGASVGADALMWHIIRRRERAASDIAIQALNKLPQKKKDEAKDLLQRAYATYDPLQFGTPDFGSGRYGELQPA